MTPSQPAARAPLYFFVAYILYAELQKSKTLFSKTCLKRIGRHLQLLRSSKGKTPPGSAVFFRFRGTYSNFLSYSRAAIRTTKQEPALCTNAPVVGFSTPMTDKVTASRLMHIDSPILNLMVLTVALDSCFR